ncbi:aminopeptidase N [Pseudoclavibacter chungangensis]|uniref:Aminopeptidase N n=1 Tax=Pseudoclavibacter chungangensis TaxID=587635 RepID=A0A7J5BRF1_9MICO|nr:aminopeptidase N [Pseudoclavibacter chungangensis]KAB1656851.1 aminopeptidase N [Pseudoclavibacter chungangensis]NYJ67314.1 aminopeptidase N [Pseudoclavibacter chungangensis]
MPGENLTHLEAQERRAVVDVHHYDVTLDLTTGDETFRSTTVVHFDAEPGSSTFIDAITRQVHRVELNGEELDPAVVADGTRIQLPGLRERNELVVEADAVYMNTGEGLHRFVDPVDGEVYLYTQFEVPDSRRVFAVFEQPDLKAQFTFHVTAPSRWQVVSNQPTPEPVVVDAERSVWHFPATPRISSYITALVAGPYVVQRDELTSSDGRTIPLGVFCRASLAEHLDAEYIFDITKRGFAYYEQNFQGPYPFAKYDQLFVPEFNAGAMENAGCVTFTEAYVFRSKVEDAVRERRVITILHELAHMWFGDLVTMKWWNDLWLNESFAEFISTIASAEATEWTEAWTTFNASEKSWAYRQDQLPSTHPIVAEINDLHDVLVNFDGITYAKGGSVLKQLFFWVGREAFFQGVAQYFRAHGWGNTELSDLLVELERASGRDLDEWAAKWLSTAGVNTLRVEIDVDGEGLVRTFSIEQSATPEYPTIRPHRLAIGLYEPQDGTLVRVDRIELDVDGESTHVPELVGRRRPAVILLNDDDLAYAKIRLDDESFRAAANGLASFASPLARALVYGSAWDATRDAELRPREFVRLVIGAIGAETESTTRRTVLGQLATAARFYTAADDRGEIIEVVADELWELAQRAEAGSDAQFAFVKAFAAQAHSAAQLDAAEALLTGETSLPGLEIDTDLGWELVVALTSGGRRTAADIDARLQEDNTADGQRAAARALASIPTAEAKEAAWERVVTRTDAPNAIVRATAAGFYRGGDDAVLRPYVARYFATIGSIWEERSFSIAEELIEGLFPSELADAYVRDAARSWLAAHEDAPAALRRLVIEGLAGIERSLRAQERDAED